MKIHCCGCDEKVTARLTDGAEIYPHRADLKQLPFWKCDTCGNHVGCHHKTADRTRPLGCIPTPELRKARQRIHALIDPLWQSGIFSRSGIYKRISNRIGYPYHSANIQSVTEARIIYKAVQEIAKEKYPT